MDSLHGYLFLIKGKWEYKVFCGGRGLTPRPTLVDYDLLLGAKTQSSNGYWIGYASRIEDQSLFTTVDITAEFVVLLREILHESEYKKMKSKMWK